MPDTDLLLILLLVAVAVVLVLLVVLLLRKPDAALDRLRGRVEEALRDEQRWVKTKNVLVKKENAIKQLQFNGTVKP